VSEPKRLYRNVQEAWVGGVAAGLAEYMGVDRTAVRVGFVLIAVFTLFIASVVAYVVMWAIIPPRPPAAQVASVAMAPPPT